MKQTDVEWFRPLWLRILVTVLVAGWTLFEWFVSGDTFWGLLTSAALVYAIFVLFISFPKTGPSSPDKHAEPEG